MPPTRPSECPACGHERIRRSAPPLERVSRGVRMESWNCRLCDYTWSRTIPPDRPTAPLEIDIHP